MQRSFFRFSFLVILIIWVFIAGCTNSIPKTLPVATLPATPALKSSLEASQSGSINLLFVQESLNASFVPVGNGNYLLTLSKVVPYTMFFSDRPDRIAGFYTMEDFIAGFNWSVSPNAAISRSNAKESEDIMIVALAKPTYNSTTKEILYTATVISNYKGEKLKELAIKSDPTLPINLGRVSLFIDSSGMLETCPSNHSYRCSDNSCRTDSNDCPPLNKCPADKPFMCASGQCAISGGNCPTMKT